MCQHKGQDQSEVQSFSNYIPHYISYSEFRLTKKFGILFASDYNVLQKVAIFLSTRKCTAIMHTFYL